MTPDGPGAVLAPLADRHAHWMSLDAGGVLADRDEAAADVRAMQLVLRMERSDPPSWSAALGGACTAATALCLDDRSAAGGDWHEAVADYVRAHIRKITRRARATQWTVLDELPGVTVDRGGVQVRALVPGPVVDLDRRIARLQVGGTDLAVDQPAVVLSDPTPGTLLLRIPEHVTMSAGKLMAQTGHAGMITAALLATGDPRRLAEWHSSGLPVEVALLTEDAWRYESALATGAQAWDRGRVAVRDAGFTEIEPGTVTVIADASGL